MLLFWIVMAEFARRSPTLCSRRKGWGARHSDGPFLCRRDSTAVLRLALVDFNLQASHFWESKASDVLREAKLSR